MGHGGGGGVVGLGGWEELVAASSPSWPSRGRRSGRPERGLGAASSLKGINNHSLPKHVLHLLKIVFLQDCFQNIFCALILQAFIFKTIITAVFFFIINTWSCWSSVVHEYILHILVMELQFWVRHKNEFKNQSHPKTFKTWKHLIYIVFKTIPTTWKQKYRETRGLARFACFFLARVKNVTNRQTHIGGWVKNVTNGRMHKE